MARIFLMSPEWETALTWASLTCQRPDGLPRCSAPAGAQSHACHARLRRNDMIQQGILNVLKADHGLSSGGNASRAGVG